ncbi:FKBP-type peptidyl-prolyl cis-trans isomerase [Marinilongibacter aquaticus]|uniref:FKBP-type peptidyl-prolyl cis-trans isomerase n=1 Tax=Marinilongibacter aquaticus TaxID=2975157 RepID=UPI0021BD0A53|nr:FKBP-type peptidyl-prolyl cis-trans isomerase [Marinilongibacter aquaticus]UBM60538.1 FKBP-type peptidyl-prolyl cis-trans isomerase [Marinilongibacter aquaticus]
MIKKKSAALALCLVAGSYCATAQTTLHNELDSLSYAIGISVGQSIVDQNIEPNMEVLTQAISDMVSKNNLSMSEEQCGMFIRNYFQNRMEQMANENLKKGQDFLAENKLRDSVHVTESGLQYEVLTPGTGAKPLETDNVKVHYHGTLIDGSVFDSSVDRGTPSTFRVNQVIKGWIEALQLMPVGSKWRLFIPADLAYGPRGHGQIGPNSTLIFDVELLDILK